MLLCWRGCRCGGPLHVRTEEHVLLPHRDSKRMPSAIRTAHSWPKKTWLGIPIFGSDFWDPHQKRNSDSVFDSGDSSQFFLLNSAVEKTTNWNSNSKIWNSKKSIPRNSVLLILHQKIISKQLPPSLHLLKTVAAIPTSTHNNCCHSYIYSKQLPPYLHLLKTVAAIPTSTQNGCRHTYIYTKWLPPYLHLLKTVAAISTSTQNKK
jgi:hypothetical protein